MTSDSIGEVLKTASFPSDVKAYMADVDYNLMYKYIREYYSDDDKYVEPLTCEISGDESFSRQTSIGVIPENPTEIQNIEMTDFEFSNYSLDALELLGIDTDEIWNGRVATGAYRPDGTLEIAETDYYTISFFAYALMVESALVSENTTFNRDIDGKNMVVRDRFASDVTDFSDKPWFATGISSGGVVANITDDEIRLLLGKRSSEPRVNKNMYSIIPNGIVTPDQLDGGTMMDATRERFEDEMFNYKSKGSNFFDQHVEPVDVLTGWNLRHASLSSVHGLLVDSEESYERLNKLADSNMEFENLVTVDVMDASSLVEFLESNPVSPICIASICRFLEVIDSEDKYPDLPYSVSTNIS